MAKFLLPNGEVLEAPDGLTDDEYSELINARIPDPEGELPEGEAAPGMTDQAATWMKDNVMDPAMMNMLDATFGGKTLGKIAGDTVAAGGSPADFKSNIVSAIPSQLGKTVLNTVGGAGATLADLGLNLPQYGIKGVDTVLQSLGVTEPATSGVPEDTQVIINPLTGQPVRVSAQGQDYSDDAKYLLDLFGGAQAKVQDFHKGLREETPLISRNPIAETTTDLVAQGSDWVGEKAGIPAEQNPVSGAIKSVGGLAGGLLTPENVALALPTLGTGPVASVAHKLLPAVFGPAAIEGAVTEGGAALDQAQAGSLAGTTEHGLNALLQGLMGGAMLSSLVPKGAPQGAPAKAGRGTPQELLNRVAPDQGSVVPPGPALPPEPATISRTFTPQDLLTMKQGLPVNLEALANQGILPESLPGAGPSPVVLSRPQVQPGTPANAYVTPPKKVTVSGKPAAPAAPAAPALPPEIATKFGLPEDIITTMANMLQGQKFTPELQAQLRKMEKSIPSGRGVRSTAGNPKLRMVIDPVTPLLEPVLGRLKKKVDEGKLTIPPFLGGITRIEKQREAWDAANQEISPELTKRVTDYTKSKTSSYIDDLRNKITDEVNTTLPDNLRVENVKRRLEALDRGELPESQRAKLYEDVKNYELEQRADLLGPVYQKHMKNKGFVLGKDGYRTGGAFSWVKSVFRNEIPEFMKADRATGQEGGLILDWVDKADNIKSNTRAELTSRFTKPVKALRKLKLDDRKVTELMQYVESTPKGGVRWNPEAHLDTNGNVKIQAYKGEVPSPQVLQHLGEMRKQFDRINQDLQAAGHDIGYYPRYVPRESLLPAEVGPTYGSQTNIGNNRSILSPSFTRERAWREGEPMETRIGHLIDSYTNRVAKLQSFSPELLSRIADQKLKYEILGDTERAAKFTQIAEETLGIGKGGISKLTHDYLVKYWKENGEAALLKELQRQGIEPGVRDKIISAARSLTSKALIGLNPKNLFAQKLDPLLRGSPDMPILELMDTFRGYTKAEKELLSRNKDALRQDTYDPYSVEEPVGLADKGSQLLYKGLSAPGEPGQKLADMFESQERARVFVAAHRWWKKTADKDSFFKNMNETEMQVVRDAMKKGGDDLAATEFARLKTQQIMGRYGKTNRPVGMRSGVGKLSMFTTFSRHELNKLWDDVSAKRYGMAARRFIAPMIPALTAGAVTSMANDKSVFENMLYYHPMMAAVTSGNVSTAPYFQVTSNISRSIPREGVQSVPKNIIKETGKLLPPVKALSLLSDVSSKIIDDKAGTRSRVRRRGRQRRSRSR